MGKDHDVSDPIFPDQHDPETATDYIANPVRVQLPGHDLRTQGRRWTQLDLIALANNIIARENECTELRKMVRELSIRFSGLQTQVEALSAVVTRLGPTSGKLMRALEAFTEVMTEDDEPEDPY
jgi:hypothetical protein